jgi:MFS family permease
LVQPFAGQLADRADPLRVMMAGLILSSAGVGLIPFTRGAPLVILCVIGGVGVGTVWTNSDAMVSNLAAKGRTASALGAAGSFKEIGDMLGPLTVGAIAQTFGLPVSFLACGALGLVSVVVLARASRDRTPREKHGG